MEGELGALVQPGVPLGFFQLQGKFLIGNWLDEVVDGIHRVALESVLGHIGDEHEHHIVPHLPDATGSVHPIEPGHIDVQNHQVELGPVTGQEVLRVGVKRRFPLPAVVPLIAPQVLPQQLGILPNVVHNGYPHDSTPPCPIFLIISYNQRDDKNICTLTLSSAGIP